MSDGDVVDISPAQDGGVTKQITRPGDDDEAPMTGDTVKVHYVGKLLDGTVFDSSRDRGEYFEFDLGKGNVIKGWDIGVATMKRNEVCILTCTPEYAYGTNATGKIPANSTLIFEVELYDWRGEDISPKKNEGSIIRRTLTQGDSPVWPNDGASVKVHLRGEFEGRVFDKRDVTFLVGEACDQNIIEGIDIAVKKFRKGETSVLKIASKYAFGTKGSPEFNIPANATVVYTMELTDFEKARESWQMDPAEKIQQSTFAKEKGTNYFKTGKYRQAVKQYKRITEYLGSDDVESTDEQKSSINQLRLAAHLNLAMCYLKVDDYFNANEQCEKALEKDALNEKGLFRRGQARVGLQNYEGAIADFDAVLKIDPTNKAAKNQHILAVQKFKQFKDKEKSKYFGMFEKMAKKDSMMEEERRRNMPDMPKIGEWDNKMADGMISIEKEAEAFRDLEAGGDQLNETDLWTDLRKADNVRSDGLRQRKSRHK